MIWGRSLADQVSVKVGKMIGERPCLLSGVSVGTGVDDAPAAQFGLGFQLACQGLGRGPVRAPYDRPTDAALVVVRDVPGRAGALAISGFLVDTRHGFDSCVLRGRIKGDGPGLNPVRLPTP